MRTSIDSRIKKFFDAEYEEGEDEIITETIKQLNEYFAGSRKVFDLPLLFAGTEFQTKVWNALLEVPYGHISTYLQLADKIGDKNAVRAVASANGANAISIIVPCHRIIGTGGDLVGYAGGLRAKKKLLELESGIMSL
jgi:methylated-DNA-[protein]-cysteine S-methyltransferase